MNFLIALLIPALMIGSILAPNPDQHQDNDDNEMASMEITYDPLSPSMHSYSPFSSSLNCVSKQCRLMTMLRLIRNIADDHLQAMKLACSSKKKLEKVVCKIDEMSTLYDNKCRENELILLRRASDSKPNHQQQQQQFKPGSNEEKLKNLFDDLQEVSSLMQ